MPLAHRGERARRAAVAHVVGPLGLDVAVDGVRDGLVGAARLKPGGRMEDKDEGPRGVMRGPSAVDRKRRLVGRTVQLPVHPWLVITMWAPTRDWLLMICTPTPLGRAEGWMAMAVECPWGRPGNALSRIGDVGYHRLTRLGAQVRSPCSKVPGSILIAAGFRQVRMRRADSGKRHASRARQQGRYCAAQGNEAIGPCTA